MSSFKERTKIFLRNNMLFFSALFFKFFVYDISMVPSCSMTPTFLTGDLVIVNKHCIRWSRLTLPFGELIPFGKKGLLFKTPERGTPCVFIKPGEPFTYYLKRLVGFEGDSVQMINGLLHINDVPVKMEFVKKFTFLNDSNEKETGKIFKITLPNGKSYHVYRNRAFGRGYRDNTPRYVVPKGHVWLQGDNNSSSMDSFDLRFLGPLPAEYLISSPVFVLINSNSRGEAQDTIAWILSMPFNAIKYIWLINTSRVFVSPDKV